jgi:electron transfer flavoprotein beta subunit
MKIVVLVKTATGAAADRDEALWHGGGILPGSLSAFDAHGVEEAVRLRERGIAGEIVVIAMASSSDVLGGVRVALAMGADRAVLLSDPELDGLDLVARSRVLATLMRREAASLYLFCSWPGDIDGTLLWGVTAARLGYPALAQARSLQIEEGSVTIERQIEAGDAVMRASLPCFVDVAEAINKPRHPTMKATLAARSRPLEVLRVVDLGASTRTATLTGARVRVTASRSVTVLDDASVAPEQILDLLVERGLIE